MKEYIVSDDELKKLCAEWQDRLRLQAWDIDASICRASEFVLPNCCGENEWNHQNNKSEIRILDHVDFPKIKFPQDMEVALVHELLHLCFESFEPKNKESLRFDLMERTIERLANVLVELKRGRDNDTD